MFYVALVGMPAAMEAYETLVARAAHRGLVDVAARALAEQAIPASWIGAQRYVETVERALQLSARQQGTVDAQRCAGFGSAFAQHAAHTVNRRRSRADTRGAIEAINPMTSTALRFSKLSTPRDDA